MNDFLKTEYEECLSLIKYYDERHQSLVKYASGLTGAIPSLLLAIFQLGGDVEQNFWRFTLAISIAVTLGLLAIFTVLIQTRLYFIYPVRQVNAIRKLALEEVSNTNFENQMYLSTSFNAFKWSSTQTLLNLFVSLQVGMFAGLAIYAYLLLNNSLLCITGIAITFGILWSLFLFLGSAVYLHKSSKYHPDKSIHKQSTPK